MGKKLTPEQYWKWRTQVAELWNEQNKKEAATNELKFMNAKAKVMALEAVIYEAKTLKVKTEECTAMEAKYHKHREELEKALGVSLKNATIDDVTFEIKPLD